MIMDAGNGLIVNLTISVYSRFDDFSSRFRENNSRFGRAREFGCKALIPNPVHEPSERLRPRNRIISRFVTTWHQYEKIDVLPKA